MQDERISPAPSGDDGLDPAGDGRDWADGHTTELAAAGLRLVTAPARGRFQPGDVAPGTSIEFGRTIGAVRAARTTVPVVAARPGVLREWLACDGDPVWAGQALAHLETADVA